MLGGDEFEYFGVVTGPFEQGRAQRVGDKLRLPLEKNPMLEGPRERRRRMQLRTEFLVAARRNEEQ